MPLVTSRLGTENRVTVLGRSPLTIRYNTGEPLVIGGARIHPSPHDCIMVSNKPIHSGYSGTGVLGFTMNNPGGPHTVRAGGSRSVAIGGNASGLIMTGDPAPDSTAGHADELPPGTILYVPAGVHVEVINPQSGPVTLDMDAAAAGITCDRA